MVTSGMPSILRLRGDDPVERVTRFAGKLAGQGRMPSGDIEAIQIASARTISSNAAGQRCYPLPLSKPDLVRDFIGGDRAHNDFVFRLGMAALAAADSRAGS